MGIFRKFASWATDKVGRGIEKIGEVTHIGFIEDLGLNMQIYNPFDRIGRTDINSATVDDMMDINAECEKVRRSAEIQSEDIVDQCITRIEDKIKEFEGQFPKEISSSYEYSLDDAFKEDVKSTISSYIAKNISIDNEEFNRILNMRDAARKEQSEVFMKRILTEAEQELKTKCNHKYIAVCNRMLNDLKEYCATEGNYMQELLDNQERIRESENAIETTKELIKEKIIDASTAESIRVLTYSN